MACWICFLQLLVATVSAVLRDIQRALGNENRVIEMAEEEMRKSGKLVDLKKLEAVIEEDGDGKQEAPQEAKDVKKPAGTVQVKEVESVLNTVYGNIDNDMEESSPIQQKILITTILLIIKNDKNKEITIGRLHDIYKLKLIFLIFFWPEYSKFSIYFRRINRQVPLKKINFSLYKKICKNLNVHPTDQSEFLNLCTLVETRGIIRMQGKKEPRFHRLFQEWDGNEIYEALKDKQMITSILANKFVLNSMK